ncbi:MAG TPA: type II secretion system protein GspN [Thermodesulfobacteriota bacterium]|nr:type II secretion system protein GspN [Thermodesulfobacteriota bacterium]
MRKRMTKSKYFTRAYYILFFILILSLFLYVTFPAEEFRRRIVYEIENRTPFDAEIKSVRISPTLKLTAYGVSLSRAEKPFLNIEDLEVSSSFLNLFSGVSNLPFEAHLLGGETKGILEYDFKREKLVGANAQLSGISIERIMTMVPAELRKQSPLIQGSIDGGFSIKLDSLSKGEFNFKVSKLGLRDIRLKNFAVPDFVDMESVFKGKIDNGMTQVEELRLEGDDIHLKLSGTMPLLWKVHEGGRIDLKFQLLSVGDRLGLLRAFLTPQKDGTMGGKIVGTLISPRVVLHEKGSL